jgi:hypothetical protein
MIEKIKITTIDIKHGTSKNGRAYAMPIIQTEDGRKMSMYIDKEYDTKVHNLEKIEELKEGDEITVSVEQNGDYINFKLPSKTDMLEGRVDVVEKDVNLLKEQVFEIEVRIEKIEGVIKNAKKKADN